MEIKLNPNNIQSVKYRLNENKTVNMHFDIDGFLADVDVEEALPYILKMIRLKSHSLMKFKKWKTMKKLLLT